MLFFRFTVSRLYFLQKLDFELSAVQSVSIVNLIHSEAAVLKLSNFNCCVTTQLRIPFSQQAILLGLGLQHKTIETLEVPMIFLVIK